jgi:hypothetical protein
MFLKFKGFLVFKNNQFIVGLPCPVPDKNAQYMITEEFSTEPQTIYIEKMNHLR